MLDPAGDPFVSGARWAAGEAYAYLFGDLLGPELWQQLGPLQVLTNGVWQDYQA